MKALLPRPLIRTLAALFVAALASTSAQAGLIITMAQVGADVVATSTGGVTNPVSFATALPDIQPGDPGEFPQASGFTGTMIPVGAFLGLGSSAAGPGNGIFTWTNAIVSGPANFGTSFSSDTTSDTGSTFILAGDNALHVSNANLFAIPMGAGIGGTFAHQTIASLGLNPGTYVWTLDAARFNSDTVTLIIQEPSAVPEPSTLALFGIASLTGLAVARRRRKQAGA
jgi:hypothetical protein